MKSRNILLVLCSCLILCGCITKYEPGGIESVGNILVVEGFITDDESVITLTRSENITGNAGLASDTVFINHADVYVVCDDDTLFPADVPDLRRNGQYMIKNGKLHLDRKYSLKIEIKENDKTYKYSSVFSNPIVTPEIDSIFWVKDGARQPVMIYVATHSPNQQVMYYLRSYKEDWEIHSEVYLNPYPCFCWNGSSSKGLIISSSEKTIFGKVTDKLIDISPWNLKLSQLYRIEVKQKAISKQAYDYFANIKKNTKLTGSIFAPTPSELRGNIICTTDPGKPVIGYVEVSTTTQKRKYINSRNNLYEKIFLDCKTQTKDELCQSLKIEDCASFNPFDYGYVVYESYPNKPPAFIRHTCVDCSLYGSPNQKPDDWPNDH